MSPHCALSRSETGVRLTREWYGEKERLRFLVPWFAAHTYLKTFFSRLLWTSDRDERERRAWTSIGRKHKDIPDGKTNARSTGKRNKARLIWKIIPFHFFDTSCIHAVRQWLFCKLRSIIFHVITNNFPVEWLPICNMPIMLLVILTN